MKKIVSIFSVLILGVAIASCSQTVSSDPLTYIEYDTTEMMNLVDQRLESIYTEDCISFGFITDLHYENTIYDKSSTHKLVEDLNQINKAYPLAGVYLGGDNMANSYNRKELMQDTQNMVNSFRALDSNVYVLKGNHDDNSLRGRIEGKNEAKVNAEIMDSTLAELYSNGVDANQANSLFSYMDLENQKIRIIYLNSIDVPYILDEQKIRYPGQWCYGYQKEQLEFLGKDALNFADKEDSGDWKVVILQHITAVDGFTDGAVHNADAFWGVLEAYQNASTYQMKRTGDFSVSLNVDYTKQEKGTIIGVIQGHLHRDKSTVAHNTNIIATKKGGLTEDQQLGYSMDIFTIDTKNNILYATRYGEGENREWSF